MATYFYDAKVKWADTGIDLTAGQETFISSVGSNGQPWGGANVGPDGAPTFRWPLSEVTTETFCQLLGRIGPTGIPFAIGSGYGFTPPASGRLYVIMNDGVNFGDNGGGFNVKVDKGSTLAIPAIISDLARYGITVYQNGLPAGQPNNRAWTFTELAEILRGVQYTARALYETRYPLQTIVPQDSIQTLFVQIMGTFDMRRVQNGYTLPGGDGCNGSTDIACTSVGQNTIVWYGGVPVTQHTAVHELGHFFNNRSDIGGAATESLYSRMEGAAVTDSLSAIVFGNRIVEVSGVDQNDWARGERGWGSGPSATKTTFQQNPFMVDDWRPTTTTEDKVTEIDEATADMFLNWVYSVATDNNEGFQNTSWVGAGCQTPAGCADTTANPGDARRTWMNSEMSDIFSEHPTWKISG